MLRSTDKKDKNGNIIYEGDILYNPISGYRYTVKHGDFTLNYTKPFEVKCLGFYIEYTENDTVNIDSFNMLELNNVEKVKNE